jgi:lipoprotein-releasing system ATP-binding protein
MSDVETANTDHVLRLENLCKSYNLGAPNQVEVLHSLNMSVGRNDFSALIGPSGSGKSTLLNIIGLLDQPTTGELYLQGLPTRNMDDEARTALRGSSIGFVFQFHHLIQAFTAIENVLMPVMVTQGKPSKEMLDRARGLLAEVGLEKHLDKKPDSLSGGQQQRVAIARALMTRPALLLADEPTGNLDTKTAEGIFELFRKFNQQFGCAVLIVTHDPRLSATCDQTINLVDGYIVKN